MLQPNTNKSLYKAQSRYVPAVSPVQKRQASFLKTLKKYVEIENRSRAEDEKEIKRNSYNDLLDICNNLGFDTVVAANNFGSVYISYNACIELLTDYFISYSNHNNTNESNSTPIIENTEIKEFNTNVEEEIIRVNLIQVTDNARYFLCGNSQELGNWDIGEAKELMLQGNILSYVFNSDTLENLEYKLFKKYQDGSILWENGGNRILDNQENYIAWR